MVQLWTYGLSVVSWQSFWGESPSCAARTVGSTIIIAMHQLKLIIDLLGTPKEADIQSIENPKFRDMIRNIPIRPPKRLNKIFPNCNDEGKLL